MFVTPLIERITFSTRCFISVDLTDPTIVTLPFSTRVLTSSFDRVGSAASVESICDWIEESSGGTLDVSPAGTAGVGSIDGLVCGVAEVLGEGFGEGVNPEPAGTVCCGASDAVVGSYGRLVMKSATNVARAAAMITLIPIHNSSLRDGGRRDAERR